MYVKIIMIQIGKAIMCVFFSDVEKNAPHRNGKMTKEIDTICEHIKIISDLLLQTIKERGFSIRFW